ncbi:hypothetical protein EK904_005292 [Melospiza melodia maxima]|nr:hypothetical protein EK904_005292 [Melospiza melodia maxima]
MLQFWEERSRFIVLLSGLLIFQLEFFSSNFTISIPVLIGQERRYCDNALLPYAHSQEPLVHASNQPSNPHIDRFPICPVECLNQVPSTPPYLRTPSLP